jgi:hypothetical protein
MSCHSNSERQEATQGLFKIIPGLTSLSLLLTKMNLIKYEIDASSSMDEVISLLKKNSNVYPNVSRVYRFFLITLPLSVASNERCFSKMKLVKNFLRQGMKGEKFEGLVLCAVERDLLENVDLSKLASTWALMKNRRVTIHSEKNEQFLCDVVFLLLM